MRRNAESVVLFASYAADEGYECARLVDEAHSRQGGAFFDQRGLEELAYPRRFEQRALVFSVARKRDRHAVRPNAAPEGAIDDEQLEALLPEALADGRLRCARVGGAVGGAPAPLAEALSPGGARGGTTVAAETQAAASSVKVSAELPGQGR